MAEGSCYESKEQMDQQKPCREYCTAFWGWERHGFDVEYCAAEPEFPKAGHVGQELFGRGHMRCIYATRMSLSNRISLLNSIQKELMLDSYEIYGLLPWICDTWNPFNVLQEHPTAGARPSANELSPPIH